MFRRSILALSVIALTGCGGMPPIAQAPQIERAPEDQLPAPDGVAEDGSFVYTLGALDTISVEVEGMPELRRELVIDGQGMVSYPMADSVSAAGMTTTELARALENNMRRNYVRDPRVSVNLVTATSNLLTVEGEVNKPGLFPVYRKMTLGQAIAMAEGDTDFARRSAVLIFRESGGQQYVGVYDLQAIRYGNYADPAVYPNDKIVVSESQVQRFLQTAQPFVSLATAPLLFLIRRN
ncbi:polysaccharide biosynthesis/export family protein [Qipengyuania sp. XHP0207]|uniref:polysaccharide biosynthesis/export family protein n=1 Tax=Qipengyuania sp. XHP0207 TaxID=3038078 RepID=UPI00241D41A5|nr:polysaccharide biosynthesis/export family protein [Qipengyuania sp. XHP0207]MDG5747270.1 polysaccharide biosynthesis/export family protein [Qipengyuania sp. XHP0207]